MKNRNNAHIVLSDEILYPKHEYILHYLPTSIPATEMTNQCPRKILEYKTSRNIKIEILHNAAYKLPIYVKKVCER